MDYYNEEMLNEALLNLVNKNLIEMGVNEEGEFVFWMTDEQKEAYHKAMED